MTTRRPTPADVAARALAGAFLGGDWDPPAMGRRGKRTLGDRRAWIVELARIVRAAYPDPPSDRPRELAELIGACSVFQDAANQPDRPLRVQTWIVAPTEMGVRRWPVPPIPDLGTLATWLGLSIGHLQWFGDRRSLERTVADERLRHHHRRWISKADGSLRLLEAPKKELKDLQRQVLHQILDRIPAHDAAHGFRAGRSVRTAAAHHHGQAVVLCLDLESFFASVGVGRVYGTFRLAGYPEPVAHALAGLCTTVTPPTVLHDAPEVGAARREQRWRLLARLRAPHLAQGSPTSPALANLIAFGLDRRLTGLAQRRGATYTRYADDLVLSGGPDLGRTSAALVRLVVRVAHDEGFALHEGKTRLRTAAQRQAVTGLVVNQRANVARPEYDRLRAILHDAVARGPAHANREGHPDFRSHLAGRIAWVGAGNEARAEKLQRAYAAIDWSSPSG